MNNVNQASAIKAVIFDWGGVISTSGSPDEASENLAAHLDISVNEAKQLFKPHAEALKRGKISEPNFWNEVSVAYGRDIQENHQDIWLGWDALQPSPVMTQFISDLKEQGYKVAILSNTFPESYELIKQNGGYDTFDTVTASSEVGLAKPELEIYQMVLDELNLAGKECLFIDDQQKCLDPAKSIFGMHTLLAVNPEQIVADTQKLLAES